MTLLEMMNEIRERYNVEIAIPLPLLDKLEKFDVADDIRLSIERWAHDHEC